jgi:hypothetical protein
MSNQEFGSLAGMRVLAAFDDLIFQRFINHHLKQWQVSADFAMNGEKAVELLSEIV